MYRIRAGGGFTEFLSWKDFFNVTVVFVTIENCDCANRICIDSIINTNSRLCLIAISFKGINLIHMGGGGNRMKVIWGDDKVDKVDRVDKVNKG